MKKYIIVFMSIFLVITSSIWINAETNEVSNLALGKEYSLSTAPRDVWEDTENTELTDGIYAPELFSDEKWQGHHKSDQDDLKRTITLDLGENKTIKSIRSNYLHDPETGIRFPKNVQYRVSHDNKTWVTVSKIQSKTHLSYELLSREIIEWNGENEGIINQSENYDSIYGRYVQIEFLIDSPWVFIDEIEVWGHDGLANNTFDLSSSGASRIDDFNLVDFKHLDNLTNYGLNKSYKSTDHTLDKKGLTDGVKGTRLSTENWISPNQSNDFSIIVDLEDSKEIAFIDVGTLENNNNKHPEIVKISVSNDAEKWSLLSEVYNKYINQNLNNNMQNYSWDGRVDGFPGSNESINKIKARYVKLEFESSDKLSLDEIRIFGSSTELGEAIELKTDDYDSSLELPEGADFIRKQEKLGNVNDIVLLYNHVNMKWNKENIIPYLSYVDREGNIKDRLYDTVLYLGLRTPSGNTFDTNTAKPSNLADWEWYLNRTFAIGGDMDLLNQAAKQVSSELKDDYKQKVFLMIPYPSTHQNDFGIVNGETLNFNHHEVGEEKSYENRKKAIDWYLGEVNKEMQSEKYENLDFKGFYWVAENIESNIPHEEDLVKYTNNNVHQLDYLNFWIPYFKASGYDKWDELGFDFSILQPNFYFEQYSKESRLEETSILAKKYGSGVEIEFDEALISENDRNGKKTRKFFDYINLSEKYGFNGDVIRAYYQGGKTLEVLAKSEDDNLRSYYDDIYEYIRSSENDTPQEPPVEEEDNNNLNEEEQEIGTETNNKDEQEKPQTLPNTGQNIPLTQVIGGFMVVLGLLIKLRKKFIS